MFDSHNHTNCSFDSKCLIDDLCQTAIKKGMRGIVISDHCDVEFYKEDNIYEKIKKSFNNALAAKEKYKGKLKVLAGVEIGGRIWDKDAAAEIMSSFSFDTVIESVHLVKVNGKYLSFSDDYFDYETAKAGLDMYYKDLAQTAEITDADILAHITYPFRYVNGKFNLNIGIDRYMEKIEETLRTVIKRNIALEVNTSGIGGLLNDFVPNKDLVLLYKKLGGKLITIGSDSHFAQKTGNGFSEAKKMIKECGFENYFYYEKRKPKKVSLADYE